MRTASAASSNLFKKSVPILKKAAAADARAKRGELAAVGEAVEMYGEGIALLEQAIDSPDFNDKVCLTYWSSAATNLSECRTIASQGLVWP